MVKTNPSSLGYRQIRQAMRRAAKDVLVANGIEPSTRRGNKELDLALQRLARQSYDSLEVATEVGQALGQKIVELSQAQGTTNLDGGIVRQMLLTGEIPTVPKLSQKPPKTTPVVMMPSQAAPSKAKATAVEAAETEAAPIDSEVVPEAVPDQVIVPVVKSSIAEDITDGIVDKADAAVDEADAVEDKADAVEDKADAVEDEADAAVDEADAAVDEADAAVDEADAAVDEADAVVDEADAVEDEADAVVDEADAVEDEADAVEDEVDAVEDGAGEVSEEAVAIAADDLVSEAMADNVSTADSTPEDTLDLVAAGDETLDSEAEPAVVG
ncbi:MAG: hypothetical protein ACFCVD_08135 [Nodosilinea sp.]